MENISFSVSVKEWTLNEACTVKFSPTDGFFAKKLFRVFSALSETQEEYENQALQALGGVEVFELAETRDAEMRGMINDVFGKDVCSDLFPDRSVYSMSDGLPEWCNLLLAVMDVMDATLVTEQKASNPRIQKYTQKYQKYQKHKR